ncbi:CSC1-like protein 2 [Elysia marginata]|uniref:CSC1-like protein 2 n=1 Tax=Elysia marginata TaxID=1093978 RepID=A0AAV4JCI9_9GAST|nr:CSC1-like protein 2 [Elysia marginata]
MHVGRKPFLLCSLVVQDGPEGFSSVFIFSCVALFITLLIFVGRISFGWFRHLKPAKYRTFDAFGNEDVSTDDDGSQEVYISRHKTVESHLTNIVKCTHICNSRLTFLPLMHVSQQTLSDATIFLVSDNEMDSNPYTGDL